MIRWMSATAIAVGSVFAIGCGQSATAPSSTVSSVTVSATGVVTGMATGTVAVQATYQNVTGTDEITIGS